MCLAVLALTTVVPAVGLASPASPTLGSRHVAATAVGFGAVKPRTVSLGGDPTGDFAKISWQGWGGSRTVGYGRGYYSPPGKPVADAISVPVALHASSLGTCKGHRAYRRLSISFKYHQHYVAGAVLGICGKLKYLN